MITALIAALSLGLGLSASAPAQRLDPPPAMVITNVVRGTQPEIDAGNVVMLPSSCQPGQGCPVWLAGHRSTHGSVFAAVADLQPGQGVVVVYEGTTYRYRVVHHAILCCAGSPFKPTADLTLQTSASNGSLHIVTLEAL